MPCCAGPPKWALTPRAAQMRWRPCARHRPGSGRPCHWARLQPAGVHAHVHARHLVPRHCRSWPSTRGCSTPTALLAARDLYAFDNVVYSARPRVSAYEDYWLRASAKRCCTASRIPAMVVNARNPTLYCPLAAAGRARGRAPCDALAAAAWRACGVSAWVATGACARHARRGGGWPSTVGHWRCTAHNPPMDDIVKQALAKWPNVPDCYGWLGLDARGTGICATTPCRRRARFRSKGTLLQHDKLLAFIARNYEHDDQGNGSFRTAHQRVYVELEATPWFGACSRRTCAPSATPVGRRRCAAASWTSRAVCTGDRLGHGAGAHAGCGPGCRGGDRAGLDAAGRTGAGPSGTLRVCLQPACPVASRSVAANLKLRPTAFSQSCRHSELLTTALNKPARRKKAGRKDRLSGWGSTPPAQGERCLTWRRLP